jgi:hypothetical protein
MSHEAPPKVVSPQERAPQTESLTVITLTKDPQLLATLHAQLERYAARFDSEVASGKPNLDTAFKHIILKTLLEEGRIDCHRLYEQNFSIKRPESDKDIFWNAINVIAARNNGETDRLVQR